MLIFIAIRSPTTYNLKYFLDESKNCVPRRPEKCALMYILVLSGMYKMLINSSL
jgi:hypothetical protein